MVRGDKAKKSKVKGSKAEKESKTQKKKAARSEEKPARKSSKAKKETKEKKVKSRRSEIEDKSSKKSKKASKEDRKSRLASAKDKEHKKSKKSRGDDEDNEGASTKKGKRSKLDVAAANGFNPYDDLDEVLDSIDKDLGLGGSSLNLDEERMHTGSLVLDMVVSKGITAGWYTVFGPEQSCKSTSALTMLTAALTSNVPILSYWDFEGSGQPDYIAHMLKTNRIPMTIEQVFGVQDPKTAQWIVKPRVRYNKPQVAERFFDYLYRLMRRLPDKVNLSGKWYFVYDDTKENRKKVGDIFDKNYWRKTKKLRVEAPDGNLQAVAICDSYPAMLGEKMDDEDKSGGGMASQARMFSEQLKRVKGRMAAKRVAVIGVNQLRQRPAVMYGDPSYEPCGESLKFFSDTRLRFTARALSAVPYVKGKGMMYDEPSVLGKKQKDEYRHIHVRGTKNKLGMPYMEGWLRLWIKDGNEEPRGFDPVWDTFMYLDSTGQVEHKSRSKILLKIKKHENAKPMDWMDFKTLIVGTKKQQKEVCEKYGLKWFDLRSFCVDQMQSGKGMGLFIEHRKNGGEREDGDDSDDSSPDEDDED